MRRLLRPRLIIESPLSNVFIKGDQDTPHWLMPIHLTYLDTQLQVENSAKESRVSRGYDSPSSQLSFQDIVSTCPQLLEQEFLRVHICICERRVNVIDMLH